MRLKFDAVMGKSLSGTVFFEMDSDFWGDIDKTVDGSKRNKFGYWSTDRASVEVKNCYLDFGVPVIPGFPYPVTVRAGVQPFGPRGFIMGAVDGAGVTVGINADPVTIIPLWAKPWEGQMQAPDDVDLYGLEANVKVSTFKIGGYGLYVNANTFPFSGVTRPKSFRQELAPTQSGFSQPTPGRPTCGGLDCMQMGRQALLISTSILSTAMAR